MKKLMFGLTAAVAVGAIAVESANVVGYNTTAMTANAGKNTYNMMGVPFTGTTTGFRLNYDLVVANATGSTDRNTADQIQIWDPTAFGGAGGYENWYYYYDDGDTPIAQGGYNGWWDYDTAEHAFEEYHATGLDVGTTFWYKAAGTYSASDKGSITFFNPNAAE